MNELLLTDLSLAARRFQALSDPTRLEILQMLAGGERCVCDLMESLDAAQSRLSFHLKTLKTAGLVRDRRAGRWVYYSLDEAALEGMGELLREMRMPAANPGAARSCCD
jgi:ArsR family transcriptional regulator, arsenate/arsenite/antimonite-responsive transcriptional repressor